MQGLVAETLALWALRLVGVGLLLVLLLAEDLQLQEKLLLLQEPGISRVHGRWRLLRLLVRWDVLVVLQLLYFRLDVFRLLVAILVGRFGLLCV